MSQLRIAGRSAWTDKLRAYRVLVDGRVVGEVREDSVLVVPMSPGPHTVQLRIDWCTSPEIRVLAKPGETLDAWCAPRFGPLRAALAVSMFRRSYLELMLAAWRGPRPRVTPPGAAP